MIKSVLKRRLGEIHTFAIFPSVSWHDILLPELKILGPLTYVDYCADLPRDRAGRYTYNKSFFEWRELANSDLLRSFEEANTRCPVDWVFAYAQGNHLLASTVSAIRQRYKVPTVNMCFDDKNSWNLGMVGGQIDGSQGIVAAFDLWWTSARVTVDWVNSEGGHGIYLPEGFTSALYPSEELPYLIPVSFVGSNYGPRASMIRYLRNHNIPVQVFGPGWGIESEVSRERMIEIFRTSQINLGHGGMSESEAVTNVKGRDFEVPAAGGGVYLTTFNPDLAQHFIIGKEILCWHSYDDLLEQIRWYLRRPDICRAMARLARARCLSEHRWLHRFKTVLEILGILEPEIK